MKERTIDTPNALEVAIREAVGEAAQHNIGGLVALALLECVKLDPHANMLEASKQATRSQIVRATVVPPAPTPPQNGRFKL